MLALIMTQHNLQLPQSTLKAKTGRFNISQCFELDFLQQTVVIVLLIVRAIGNLNFKNYWVELD